MFKGFRKKLRRLNILSRKENIDEYLFLTLDLSESCDHPMLFARYALWCYLGTSKVTNHRKYIRTVFQISLRPLRINSVFAGRTLYFGSKN